MFSKRVKHYHQWPRSAIPFKAKLDQISSDSIRVQGPTKRPSLGHLYPVSLVKERYRKDGKRKISRVLQSPVPSTQASPKVEASHRPKQAQHFSPCRKVQNGNPGVHPDFPGPRGVGIVDRPVGRIPSHPHPSKLKEVPKVLLQGPGVPVSFSFVGYEYHLDSALVRPTPERWLKLQDLILRLKSKRVLTARCLMSLIGLLASTEKMVPEGRLHMRPFQFHLKEHWRYPQSLDNLLPWTEAIVAHLDWWQNPSNVMKGALNRDPTTTPSVNDPTQTVPQVCVPQQPTTAEPPRLVSRSGQLQEQGFSVEVAERIAAPQRSSTRTIYRSKWALFEKWCRENSVDFSTPSVKQISDFFMYLYQDLNRRPSTIDGYRTAVVDTLGPTHCTQCRPS